MESSSLHFTATARTLGTAARRHDLIVPGFRTPPKLIGAERTIRRHPSGGATISVVVRGRPFQAVIADMIEGIIVTNGLTGAAATRLRTELWENVLADRERAA